VVQEYVLMKSLRNKRMAIFIDMYITGALNSKIKIALVDI
jgi:hypothetical protein